MTRVMVTPRSMSAGGNPALERLVAAGVEVITPAPGRQPTAKELAEALPGVSVWIAGVEQIDAALLAQAADLRAICRNGAGVDGIDPVAAARHGIEVIPARGANAHGVAELALALVISGFRGLFPAASALKQGTWTRETGRELSGATLGIVGYGAIGRILGTLARGCGMHVIAHDPFLQDSADGTALVSLHELLAASDAISLHVPPQPSGPLIGAPELALVRPGTVLINTARSSLVDPPSVLDALNDERLTAYAVDAFDVEPPVIDALLAHPRVIASPHLGAATAESIRRASEAAVDNALAVLAAR